MSRAFQPQILAWVSQHYPTSHPNYELTCHILGLFLGQCFVFAKLIFYYCWDLVVSCHYFNSVAIKRWKKQILFEEMDSVLKCFFMRETESEDVWEEKAQLMWFHVHQKYSQRLSHINLILFDSSKLKNQHFLI